MSACIFCKIVEGSIPCHKVAESAKALAFMDINPIARGHVLVIPKEHAETLDQVPLDTAADVGRLVAQISRVVAGPDRATQYNVLQNNGRLAHQEVPHVHFHLIPKRDAETGLTMGWGQMPTDHEAFAADAKAYREALEKVQ
ncbi:bis(5'-nucleosidyl)-tetraphosphatase [Strigomonas culicis]|uniref:Bis(5'-nucleosidyl)-tetraphosphatase n=1 Tax=Strigomonas culicis TaxID=28005 RepID=S9W5S0_9TRYP|nr:bis(5'-nucleosidyl)-tetraphosphatase [Strigomonas culicis]|eukprot:EPY31230.1 bis(5'-nucleosidyl)-tetraphosphatase [Strigomonas culicis]